MGRLGTLVIRHGWIGYGFNSSDITVYDIDIIAVSMEEYIALCHPSRSTQPVELDAKNSHGIEYSREEEADLSSFPCEQRRFDSDRDDDGWRSSMFSCIHTGYAR